MTYVDRAEIREHLSGLVVHEGGRSDEPEQRPWLKPYVWRPPNEIPRRQWLYGGHYIRDFLTATFAPGGVGKSMLEIAELMAMASDKPILGVRPTSRLRAAYWNGEDPLEETERRVAATAKHFGLGPEDLEGWFFWGSGREAQLTVAEQTRDGTMVLRPNVDRVKDYITDLRLDVLSLDPFVATHRVTENDNNAIDVVSKLWGSIAGETNVGIEMVHHTTKAAIGRETRVEDGRGGGALLFAVRSARVLNTMSEEEAKAAGVEPRFRRYHFRVDNGKANLAPPPERSDWYRFVGVDLGNGPSVFEPGDNIGVPVSWQWPEGVAPVSPTDKPTRNGRLSPAGAVVMQAFGRLFDEGNTYPAPSGSGAPINTRAVQLLELRNKAIDMGIFTEPKPDRDDRDAVKAWQSGARNAWKRGWEAVRDAGLLRTEAEFVWEIHSKSTSRVTSRFED